MGRLTDVVDGAEPIAIECVEVSKSFGVTRAVREVDLRVMAGSIHGIVGENGAGKSTLGRIMAGAVRADSGTMRIDGTAVRVRSPADARRAGVALVSQELSLAPSLTAADNVFLGIESTRGPFVRRAAQLDEFAALTKQVGIHVDADVRVEDMGPADQQRVEILRAAATGAKIIVVDEPTTRLDARESERLAETLRGLRRDGATIVLISHALEWLVDLCDEVTIMRDGEIVETRSAGGSMDAADLVPLMVGRPADLAFPTKHGPNAEAAVVLRVEGLRHHGGPAVSFQIREGEILGIVGLVGSGRSEMAHVLVGSGRREAGEVFLDGRPFNPRSPRASQRRGVLMVSESRREQGVLPGRSVQENVSLPWTREISRRGWLSRATEATRVHRTLDRVEVVRRSIAQPIETLSGGNQQKALFARWADATPRLFIADEPTRGVDRASRQVIHRHLVDVASAGAAVLLISSDLDELVGLAHRAVVMRSGAIVAEFDDEELDPRQMLDVSFAGDGADEAVGA